MPPAAWGTQGDNSDFCGIAKIHRRTEFPTLLYFASIVLTFALSGGLALVRLGGSAASLARTYAGLTLGVCFLALVEILSMLSPTEAQSWFRLKSASSVWPPSRVFWLMFALEYSGRRGWLSKRLLAGMFVVPIVTQVLLWSNDLHGLWVGRTLALQRSGPFWIAEIGFISLDWGSWRIRSMA